MSAGDQKLHREILITIYENLDPDFRGYTDTDVIYDEFHDFDKTDLTYHIDRLEETRLLEWVAQRTLRLTPNAIEKIDREGYKTFLNDDSRYEFLRVVYEKERNEGVTYVSSDDVIEEAGLSDEEYQRNRWYLREKGLLDATGMGNFQLTGDGRNRYEEYRDQGMPIPRTHPLQQFTQHTIGEGEHEKVENIFRDIVELARNEVIVIDQFGTKDPLWEWLEHVPDVVDVKILASDREINDESTQKFEEYASERTGDTDLRYLDYYGYPFHSREVIRDREDGWIWDHTIPDSGKGHHTISQLRPVNLENDLDAFDDAWEDAEVV